MDEWLELLNEKAINVLSGHAEAAQSYSELHMSFCMIHPFADGNGRLARLLANVPILKSGFPPITIAKEHRQRYLELMFAYTWLEGKGLKPNEPLVKKGQSFEAFTLFVKDEWQATLEIVQKAKLEQKKRNG